MNTVPLIGTNCTLAVHEASDQASRYVVEPVGWVVMDKSARDTEPGIQSAHNTLRVFEVVALNRPIGVSEVARLTELPKSSAQRCLVTLQSAGWLCMVNVYRGLWDITDKPMRLGLRAEGIEHLRDIAVPVMEQLSIDTSETVQMAVREGDSLVTVARRDSSQAIRTFVEIGTRAPLHATASGLALMARLGDREIDELLSGELARFTEATITDKAVLLEEIETIRRRGFGSNSSGSFRPGVAAIGVAVVDQRGVPVATFAISVPQVRFDESVVPEFGWLAMEAAARVSRLLSR